MKEGLVSTVNVARANRFWRSVGVRFQKVPTPEVRILLNVITDELQYRIVCLTGEAFTLVLVFCYRGLSRNKLIDEDLLRG